MAMANATASTPINVSGRLGRRMHFMDGVTRGSIAVMIADEPVSSYSCRSPEQKQGSCNVGYVRLSRQPTVNQASIA